jgi:hypothetical protein
MYLKAIFSKSWAKHGQKANFVLMVCIVKTQKDASIALGKQKDPTQAGSFHNESISKSHLPRMLERCSIS